MKIGMFIRDKKHITKDNQKKVVAVKEARKEQR